MTDVRDDKTSLSGRLLALCAAIAGLSAFAGLPTDYPVLRSCISERARCRSCHWPGSCFNVLESLLGDRWR
ncbi:MAG: hypothetical protein ABIT36_09255 [Steroidobacteraceae bacterium]